MKSLCMIIGFLVIFVGSSSAQQGTAEPDYYPMGYFGDTWTGEVTFVNDDTREFTLTYKKGNKVQTFIGVLPNGYTVKMKDGKDYEIKMSDLVGLTIKAYYIPKSKKVNEQKVTTNGIFKIKFVTKDK